MDQTLDQQQNGVTNQEGQQTIYLITLRCLAIMAFGECKMPKKVPLDIIHGWVVDTLKQNEWSAREWAMKANVAPSTLQRFIKEKPWVLSATVISKLSSVSGTFPELNPLDSSIKIKPVILQIMGVKKGTILETKHTTNAFGEFGPNAYAIPVSWDTMDMAGYRKGDMVHIDPDQDYKSGDELLIKTKNSIAIYELQQHLLIARSSKKYETLDIAIVDVLGKVVSMTRLK